MPGLDDLLQQLRDRRQDQLQQYNMDAVMEDINQRLEEILKTERAGIQKRLGRPAERWSAPRAPSGSRWSP